MTRLKNLLTAGVFGAAISSLAPTPAAAYPIDCAILLCLAGGFPASTECMAAKAEMIRRITPWPIEPPLQLWRCPMGLPKDVAAAIGQAAVSLGPDGLTTEVRQYRDAIEIYQINYVKLWDRDGGGYSITDNTLEGDYRESDGEFFWKRSSYREGPDWLAEAVGGFRKPIYVSYGPDNRYERIEGYQNDYGRRSQGTRLRAIAMRFKDYKGDYYTEVVRY